MGKISRTQWESNVKAALAAFVQEHMPWPFSDVSRYDDEATDAAHEITTVLLPRVLSEFDGVAETAKAVKRRSYPAVAPVARRQSAPGDACATPADTEPTR